MFERQGAQTAFVMVAGYLLLRYAIFLPMEDLRWFLLGAIFPIIHHTYVMLAWRSELHHKWVTRTFGPRGFDLYVFGFFFLAVCRIIPIVVVAMMERGTLPLSPVVSLGLSGVCTVLGVYALYSVIRYFGFRRAAGADHFEEKYRTMPFVKKGIFRYTSNAMYTYAILLIWVPGLLTVSKSALILALFNHAYVWVHYYCLEKPDIKRIYGE